MTASVAPPGPDRRGVHRLLAAAVFAATLAALVLGGRSVGITRDEGVYMEAGRRYGAWAARLVHAPARALAERDRTFSFNWEHPDLLKTAFGLSARLLAQPPVADRDGPGDDGGRWPILPESAAMRLPAQAIAALGTALLFWVAARRWSIPAGLVAAGAFILAPRVYFHAHLAAFDVPVAVAIFAVVLLYRRSLRSARALVPLAVVFGLAIATKLNALFVGPLLYLHYLAVLARAHLRGRPVGLRALVPAWALAAAAGGPLVAFALWPWLWSDPAGRFAAFVRFHAAHPWYNMEYLGVNYNLPPLPVSYPFVLTAATVPTTVLVLAVAGLCVFAVCELRRPAGEGDGGPAVGFWAPLRPGDDDRTGLLFVLFALWPLALIAWPTVPIFGGTKHWFPAYPFFALAAGFAFHRLVRGVRPVLRAAAAALVLLPALSTTARSHPYGLSAYVAFAGGARGGARLGLGRGFWGHAVVDLLPALPARGRIYPHDLHALARRTYVREGRWSPALLPAGPAAAGTALYFPERHMAADEVRIWNGLGTTRPSAMTTLHDVPLCLRYDRPPP